MATPNDAQTILRPLRLVRYAGELTFSSFGIFASIFVQAAAPVEHAEREGAVSSTDLGRLKSR